MFDRMVRKALCLLHLVMASGAAAERPVPAIPPIWPGQAQDQTVRTEAPVAIGFATLFRDARLDQLIRVALDHNQDIRLALANMEAARAMYRIRRASLFPEISTTAEFMRSDPGGAVNRGGARNTIAVQGGTSAYEIDLFGRLRAQRGAAFDRYLASAEGARAVRLNLIADVAEAWLNHAADVSLLDNARATLTNAQATVRLTRARLEQGLIPAGDLRQAEGIAAGAAADVARFQTAIAQDINALQRLAGLSIDDAKLAGSIDEASAGIGQIEPGLSSLILLNRPDIMQAEHELRAADGDVSAARAALFPTISLTGLAGFASNALTSLFTGGAFSWASGIDARYAIFSGGERRAGLSQTRAQRDASIARFQTAIQTAFREMADLLARRDTYHNERQAREEAVTAAKRNYDLANARYRAGLDPFLLSLDAQRTLYAARQSLIATYLVGAVNQVSLYRAVGGEEVTDRPRSIT